MPLKIGGVVTGLLALGAFRADALNGFEEQVEEIASLLPLAMEKNRLSSSVTKRDQEMESIKQIGSILAASTFDRQEVLKHTMDMIRTIMNVEAGSLLLLEEDELAFKVAFNINPAINIDDPQLLPCPVSVRESPAIPPPAASRSSSGMRSDSRHFNPDFDRQTGFRTRSVLCVPLISRGKVLGVIEVLNKINGDFNDDDLHLLQSIATSVSIALENSQLYQETLSMAEHERGIRKMFQKFVPREIVDKIIHNAGDGKAADRGAEDPDPPEHRHPRFLHPLQENRPPADGRDAEPLLLDAWAISSSNTGGSSTSTWATAFWPSSAPRSPGQRMRTTPSPPPWR